MPGGSMVAKKTAVDGVLGLLDRDSGQGSRYHYCAYLEDRRCHHPQWSPLGSRRPPGVPASSEQHDTEYSSLYYWDRGECPHYVKWATQEACPFARPSRDA